MQKIVIEVKLSVLEATLQIVCSLTYYDKNVMVILLLVNLNHV